MTTRRAFAIPLLAIGGLLLTALGLATVAGELWYSYVGIKQIVEGNIGEGLATFFITSTIFGVVCSVLSVPLAALWASGEALWAKPND